MKRAGGLLDAGEGKTLIELAALKNACYACFDAFSIAFL